MPSSASIPWLVLDIEHQNEDSAWIAAALESSGFEGWEVHREQPNILWRLYFPLEGSYEERLASLVEKLEALNAKVSKVGKIRDEDWAENWKEFYHPFAVGERLVIAPSWEAAPEQMAKGRLIMRIDPGSAFGTGYHESSRLCLLGVEELSREPGWGDNSLLDYGTGSGILAIGALLLGSPKVIACDRDPVAVKVAGDNLRLNGFSPEQFTVERCDLPQPPQQQDADPSGKYFFIVANLTADILCQLSAKLVSIASGHIILGGIVEVRAQKVLDAFQALGCKLIGKRLENEWVSYHLLAPISLNS